MEIAALSYKVIKSTNAYVKKKIVLWGQRSFVAKSLPWMQTWIFRMTIYINKFSLNCPKTYNLVIIVWSSTLQETVERVHPEKLLPLGTILWSNDRVKVNQDVHPLLSTTHIPIHIVMYLGDFVGL